jgi:hypothetical protein
LSSQVSTLFLDSKTIDKNTDVSCQKFQVEEEVQVFDKRFILQISDGNQQLFEIALGASMRDLPAVSVNSYQLSSETLIPQKILTTLRV